jgi:NitT/TauT family transport system substrate-binding protein
MHPPLRTLARPLALTAVTGLVLTACASGDPAGSGTGDDTGDAAAEETAAPGEGGDLTEISVGVLPIVDTAAIYLGVDQGFYEEEGLDVSLEVASGGAAVVPGVTSGAYQFGFSNAVSVMVARDKGLPLKIVSAAVGSTGDPESDMGAIMQGPEATFEDAGDLEGAKVAVNNVASIGTVLVSHVVEKNGGDPTTIEFVELGFPDMPAALERGDVDAAWIFEPFITIASGSGSEVLSHLLVETDPELMLSVYFADEGYIAENPDVYDKFVNATTRSLEFADENPEEVREILSTYTQIPDEVREQVILPRYPSEVDVDSLELLAGLAQKHGALVGEDFDVQSVLP